MEQPSAYRGEAEPLHYCYRITTHLCLNRLRAQRVRRALDVTDGIEEAHQPASVEARDLLLRLFDRLDERELQVATLHFFDQLTQEEIALVMGHARKTIGLVLQRVRAAALALADEPERRDV